ARARRPLPAPGLRRARGHAPRLPLPSAAGSRRAPPTSSPPPRGSSLPRAPALPPAPARRLGAPPSFPLLRAHAQGAAAPPRPPGARARDRGRASPPPHACSPPARPLSRVRCARGRRSAPGRRACSFRFLRRRLGKVQIDQVAERVGGLALRFQHRRQRFLEG